MSAGYGYHLVFMKFHRLANVNLKQKKAPYLSVDVFSTELLIGDSIFTSLTEDGAVILRSHPSHAKV